MHKNKTLMTFARAWHISCCFRELSPTGVHLASVARIRRTGEGKGESFLRVVKGIFVTGDRPFLFLVKREMANFFLVNRDFHSGREAWFCKTYFRETRNKCLIRREPWFSLCLSYLHCLSVTSWLIPVILRQRGWSGFRWPLASHHFHSLFRLFRP